MTGKIGRNDRCVCGSGKKYKKCCLQSDSGNVAPSIDFYSRISSLQLDPRNLGHCFRIEDAICKVSAGKMTAPGSMDVSTITKWFNDESKFFDSMRAEDPPEGLFTENISYHGGNYIIYPGIQDSPGFTLNCLFEGVSDTGHELPDELKQRLFAASIFCLSISDKIAERMAHSRWMKFPEREASNHIFADADLVESGAAGIVFRADELERLCRAHDIDLSICDSFCIEISDPQLKNQTGFFDSIFHAKPLLKIGTEYVVTSLSGLVSSLRHFYICEAKRQGKINDMAKLVQNAGWNRLENAMRLLRFRTSKLSSTFQRPEISSQFFQFDSDKLCLLIQVIDDCTDYDEALPFGRFNSKPTVEAIERQIEGVIASARSTPEFAEHEVLILFCHFGVGRDGLFGFNTVPKRSRFIGISAPDLEVLAFQREFDAIDLWNYAVAEDDLKAKGVEMRTFCFLDALHLYQKHNESFYLSDERSFTHISAPTDGARPYREKAALLNDFHNVVVPGGRQLETVTRLAGESKEIPIFCPLNGLGQRLLMAVEGNKMPIWVGPNEKMNEDLLNNCFPVCDGIAYWLWQLTPFIKNTVNGLGKHPFYIEFELLPDSADQAPKAELEFDWSFDNASRKFTLSFPYDFDEKNRRQDNFAERVLVRTLLLMLSHALKANGLAPIKNPEAIIENVAPLGFKKKILSIHTGQIPALHPGIKQGIEKIRSYNLEKNLDGLGTKVQSALQKHNLQNGPIAAELRKDVLDIVKDTYLRKITDQLKVLDKKKFLVRLVTENESVTREREFTRITNPTSLACYFDLEEKAKELAKEMPRFAGTAIGIRTAIEIGMASAFSGSSMISKTQFNEMVAACYGFVNWGMLGDEIRCRVVDHKLSILPTGRIGIDRLQRSGFEDYVQIKSVEGLEKQIRGLESSEAEEQADKIQFEEAFSKEYGIALEMFKLGCSLIITLPFKENEPICVKGLNDLKSKIVNTEFDSKSFELLMKMLCLEERPNWSRPPDGYRDIDINPWRFSRPLSYMYRPILRMSDGTIIYGPRHLSISTAQFISRARNGEFDKSWFKSKEMRTYVALRADRKGVFYEKVFFKFATEKSGCRVEKSLEIGPGQLFEHTEDLGDIDCLVLDTINKRALVVECKNLDPGRTPAEIGQEIDRLIKDVEGRKSRMVMHNERVEWLTQNWNTVVAKLGLEVGGWSIHSVFVTSEEIPAPRIVELPLPLVAHTELIRKGFDILWPTKA